MSNSVLYLSSDASAPTWASGTGGLIAFLDAVLVNGYGSKPAAGWTKVFTGTNKAVYRSGATGNRFYLRVNNTSGTATLRAYETMSDVDTGTGPFPSVAQSATGTGLDPLVSGGWAVAANDRAFYIFNYTQTSPSAILPGVTISTANSWQSSFAFGRFTSLVTGDNYNHFILGGAIGGSGAGTYFGSTASLSGINGGGVGDSSKVEHLARAYDGVAVSQPFQKHYLGSSFNTGLEGPLVPDTVTGQLRVQDKVTILENQGGAGIIHRGYLPGIMFPIARLNSPSRSFYTFGGSGALSGRTFTIVPFCGNSGVIQFAVFEFGVDWGN